MYSAVSACKYRPQKFENVVGQDIIVATLRNEIISGNIHNSYLFCGQHGVGKTTLARILSKAINCKKAKENNGNPCGECDVCKMNVFFELDAASNNSVEDIRNIIDNARYSPCFGEYNVFIIDEVHMLSQSAFNAFLKTLEEPTSNTVFILATTDQHKIPPTIISRCQCFNFKQISIKDIVDHLTIVLNDKDIIFENNALNIIAEKANGSLRDAFSILDGVIAFCGKEIKIKDVKNILNILDEEVYFDLCEMLLQKNTVSTIVFLNNIIKNGFSIQSFLDGLINHFMNLFLAKNDETLNLINCSKDKKNKYKEQALNFKNDSLYEIMKILNEQNSLKLVSNKKFFTEITLLNIIYVIDNFNR